MERRRCSARPVIRRRISPHRASPAHPTGIWLRSGWPGRVSAPASSVARCSIRNGVACRRRSSSRISTPLWCAGPGPPAPTRKAPPAPRHLCRTRLSSRWRGSGWRAEASARARDRAGPIAAYSVPGTPGGAISMATVIGWLEHVGVTFVFLFVLVEQAGLPLPAYPLLIIAGAWSAQGGAPYASITAVAVAACLIADLGWYVAGRRLGSRVLRAMCKLTLEPDSCVSDTERMFTRFGTRGLAFAKFVPGLGAVAPAMSGVVGAPLGGFLLYDLIGATLWAGAGIALGVIFHDAVDSVFAELATLGRLGAILIVGVFAAFLTLKWWRRHQFFHELRMSRISVAELSRLREAGRPLMVIDARPSQSRARDGMIPGAVAFEMLEKDATGARNRGEVVVYCACPNEATAARVAKRLISMGFHPVRPLAGGIHAWLDAGLAIERPGVSL